MPTIVHEDHVNISATVDSADAWARVKTGCHALRRSLFPGDKELLGEAMRAVRYQGTERVEQIGRVLLRPVETSLNDMRLGTLPSGHEDFWALVRSVATRGARWIQYVVAEADPATLASALPPGAYFLEPGVVLRLRLYELPLGQTALSYLEWRFYDSDTNTVVLWLRLVRAYADEDSVREGWYAGMFAQPLAYSQTGGAPPDVEIPIVIRVVNDTLIVTGGGADFTAKLPPGVINPYRAYHVEARAKGGQALWHLNQRAYVATGQVWEAEAEAYYHVPPSHVSRIGHGADQVDPAAEFVGKVPSGTGITASVVPGTNGAEADLSESTALRAILSGTGAVSPQVVALTELREAVLTTPVADAEPLGNGLVSAVVRLTREGRGQTCTLTYDDPFGTELASLAANQVIAVSAGWNADLALTPLFTGRLTGPLRSPKRAGGKFDPTTLTVADAAASLVEARTGALTGTWAGRSAAESIADLLQAGGVNAARITVTDDVSPLMGKDSSGLRFEAGESILRLLDGITKARGWVWGCDHLGNFYAGPEADYATELGTLDDASADFATYPHEVTVEESTVDGYADQILVESVRPDGGVDTYVHAPDVGAPGVWYHERGEFDSAEARARELAAEKARHKTAVAFALNLDLATNGVPNPRGYWTAGVLAGCKVAEGAILQVETVEISLDAETERAIVSYVCSEQE